MFVAGLKAAANGVIIGGLIGGIMSAINGNSFMEGLVEGAVYGFINGFTTGALMFCASQASSALSKASSNRCASPRQCFVAGTLVLTATGLVKIEDIKVGDEVWAYDEETKEKSLKKVKQLFRKETKEWLHIFIRNGESNQEEEIICTPNHRIYIKGKGWIKANEILAKDEVLLYNDTSGKVTKTILEKLSKSEVTYNFEVEELHNYFVSKESILVHNDCGGENNILKNIEYTDKVKVQMLQDINHGFPSMIDDIAGVHGKIGAFTGGDGIVRTAGELPGAINGKIGIYQYIIEPNRVNVNHRLFTTMGKSLLGG